MNKKGSALILVLTLTTLLMTLMITFWKKSSLLLDLAITRQNYYQNLCLTKKALNGAIKIVSKNLDLILEQKELIPVTLDFSFLSEAENKNITVIISGIKEDLLLSANLCENNKLLCKLSCVINRDENLAKYGDGDADCFMADGFTVSNFI